MSHVSRQRIELLAGEHLADLDFRASRGMLHVHPCPHRAVRIVQHFGRDRSQDESPERAVSVGGHHDQAHALRCGVLDDLPRGVSFQQNALRIFAGKFINKVLV